VRGWTWQSTQGGSSAPGPPPERVATREVMPPTRELGAAAGPSLSNEFVRHASSASPRRARLEGLSKGAPLLRPRRLAGGSVRNGVARGQRVAALEGSADSVLTPGCLRPCAVCVTDRGRLAVAIQDFRQPAASKERGSSMALEGLMGRSFGASHRAVGHCWVVPGSSLTTRWI